MKNIIKIVAVLLVLITLPACDDQKDKKVTEKYDVWIHPVPGVNKYVGRVKGMSACAYYAKRVILGIKDKQMAEQADFTCCKFGSKEMCPKKIK